MSLAAYALTSVESVQAILGTGFSTAKCQLAINAVSQGMAKYTGRTWEQGTATEFHKGHGQELLVLKRPLITAVSSVYINDDAQTLATLDNTVTPGQINGLTVYRTAENDARGVLQRFSGWPIGHGAWGDLTGQPNLNDRATNIRVVYTGGFGTVPYDLQQACLFEVCSTLSRPVGGLRSERTPGGWSQTWEPGRGSGGEFSSWSERTLDDYKREWF